MQHFLKAASRTTREEVVPAELLYKLFARVYGSATALDLCSEGNPRRRLLLGVEGGDVGKFVLVFHGEAPREVN